MLGQWQLSCGIAIATAEHMLIGATAILSVMVQINVCTLTADGIARWHTQLP